MKILVYDDNPDFGGHQVMACRGIAALAAEPALEIECMLNPANHRLAAQLRGADIPVCPAQARMPAPPPDLVLCIQGDIAQSTAGIRAARKAGIECVSYLALPHRRATMGAKLGALRDGLNKKWVNAPDRFITLSESMKRILLDRGCTQPIAIVPNGIPAPPSPKHQVSSIQTIGLVGRIEFNQKQQDFMARTFLANPAFNDCRLLFVGSGPDEARLRALIAGEDRIALWPWQDDMEAVYNRIDLLAIPSRYEGVPLVMLEALARSIPVIGSNRDGMQDILPPEWTFAPENATSLASAFSAARTAPADQLDALRQTVLQKHALQRFNENFVTAVTAPGAPTS
ncbi:glycosyltransferase family 4 protein [Pontiella sp.]|uniref:glycosyltransferase family 4 protein n=1 Tax=Pontiella sp. TaxID=2837462 RepID=UPI003562010F